ncbi:MAG: endo-1,4-beta-xylanase [Clostridia bacterium]|nr:endo-1,4-beta-xylanase [Clostridia bacterium]
MKKLALIIAVVALFTNLCIGETSQMKYDEFDSLYALCEPYGFKIGACLSYNQLGDRAYLNVVSRHFNSLTCTNETKAYSLLDQNASRHSTDGMPRMNFTNADRMVRWAQQNGIGVRGHVLVWDAYMTSWFFHEDYLDSKPFASQEVMRERLRSYIEQVITHFETEFPGVIYCWDVVNEAIGDNSGEYELTDLRHIRTRRNGEANPFVLYVGSDYVEFSFLCAKDTVEALGADIKLYYNDYNMFYDSKLIPACELIERINSYAFDENGDYRTLIDGIGMQGYIGGYGTQSGCMNYSDIDKIENAIRTYGACGVEVQLTEMAVRNFDKTKAAEHAAFYAALMERLMGINTPDYAPLTAVTIWGMNDVGEQNNWNTYSWKLNGAYGGLLTSKNEIKTSFEAVYKVLGGGEFAE